MIRRAKPEDLAQINQLLAKTGFQSIDKSLLKDFCLVGILNKTVCGVVWASIGKSRFIAYVDYLAVDPQYKGLGARLSRDLVVHFKKMGVKKIMSLVIDSEHTKESLSLQEGFGMGIHPSLFHFCLGEVDQMAARWER